MIDNFAYEKISHYDLLKNLIYKVKTKLFNAIKNLILNKAFYIKINNKYSLYIKL
jgi:hypothetical protein